MNIIVEFWLMKIIAKKESNVSLAWGWQGQSINWEDTRI